MSKNLIFCFDGTDNSPEDAKPERRWFGLGRRKDNSVSNIFKLHLFFGGDLNNNPTSETQHSFYFSGVGTYGSWLRQKYNAAVAPDKMDVRYILNMAGAELARHYQAGDRVFLFGFSRGAALARRFAAIISHYVPTINGNEQVVRFLGVYDTVASIGAPNLDDDKKPRTKVVFENITVSPHIQECLHLLSIDETRIAFQPTLMNREERVTEVWFPGAHSDVGGGFLQHALSDIGLSFMLNELRLRQLGLAILKPEEVDLTKLRVASNGYQLTLEDIAIKSEVTGPMHCKKRFWPFSKITLDKRYVRVNEHGQPSTMAAPLVYYAMPERAKADGDYRPPAMNGVRHNLLDEQGGMVEFSGLGDHLLD